MKTLVVVLAALFGATICLAQNAVFEKVFGDLGLDIGYSVIQTPDGNYVLTGTLMQSNTADFHHFLAKVNGAGEMIWFNNSYHSKRPFSSTGYCVIPSSDGNIVSCGMSTVTVGTAPMQTASFLMKVNQNGDLLWKKEYYVPPKSDIFSNSGYEYAFKVIETTDGGYATCGMAQYYPEDSLYWGVQRVYPSTLLNIKRMDNKGNPLWNTILGRSSSDSTSFTTQGFSLVQLNGEGFVVTGVEVVNGRTYNIFLARIDKNGKQVWEKSLNCGNSSFAYDIKHTADNQLLLLVNTMCEGEGSTDVQLQKIDLNGELVWSTTYGGLDDDYGNEFQQTKDGGYIIAGSTSNFNALLKDAYILKVDSLGNKEWQQLYGGAGEEIAYSIKQTQDSGYIVVGGRNYQIYLFHINATGEITHTPQDTFGVAARLFPNPASEAISVEYPVGVGKQFLYIYDMYGNKLLCQEKHSDTERIDISRLSAGVYTLHIEHNAQIVRSEKMVVLR